MLLNKIILSFFLGGGGGEVRLLSSVINTKSWKLLFINESCQAIENQSQLVFTRSLFTGRLFSRAFYWLYVFPLFSPAACLPALCTGHTFSRSFHWLLFSRALNQQLLPTALNRLHICSRAWHRLPVLLRVPIGSLR